MQKWIAEFKRRRESFENDSKSERPETASTEEYIDRVHHMVISDKRLIINEIVNAVSISG